MRSGEADPAAMAVVALGANLPSGVGGPLETLQAALERLSSLSASPLLVSSLLVTEPVDCPPGSPPFVNAVVAFHPLPDETPESLLDKLQELELAMGRQRSGIVNEARTLDLDLIAFKQEIRQTARLSLPHPRAHLRHFVLLPLQEILPSFRFPGNSSTLEELLFKNAG